MTTISNNIGLFIYLLRKKDTQTLFYLKTKTKMTYNGGFVKKENILFMYLFSFFDMALFRVSCLFMCEMADI